MAKYLIRGSYTVEGTKGVLKGGGGTARRNAIQDLLESVGGKLDTLYFAFGSDDYYVICDVPDNVSAAAVSVTVAASGAVSGLQTVVLLTPEELDAACKKSVKYRPPGQ